MSSKGTGGDKPGRGHARYNLLDTNVSGIVECQGQDSGTSFGTHGRRQTQDLQEQSKKYEPGPQPRSLSKLSAGRPAGASESGSDDDDFEMSGFSSFKKRPDSAPPPTGSKSATTRSVGGTHFFTPDETESLDVMNTTSDAAAISNYWGHAATPASAPTDSAASDSSPIFTLSAPSFRPSTATGSTSHVDRPLRGRDVFPSIPYLDQSVVTNMTAINKSWNNGFPVNRDSCLAYISVALRSVFQSCPNPYSAGLYFMGFSGDFFTCKQGTLSNQVLVELKKWLMERGLAEYEKNFLSTDIQLVAFNIVTRQRNTAIIKLVCEIYRLDKVRNELAEPIKKLCDGGYYKEACLTATYLGLQTQFSIHDFVIPLLLQDREFVVEEYLAGSKEKQVSLVSFLDEMLDEKNNSVQAMSEYVRVNGIKTFKLEKMQVKPLTKLVTRLIDKFKADPIHCPNFSRKKRSSALRHLVYRKYDEQSSLNDACFEEMVDTTVLEDPILQDEIIYLIRTKNDLPMAAKFALRHALPLDRVPSDVQRAMYTINPNVVPLASEPQYSPEDEDWGCEVESTPKPKAKTNSKAKKSVSIVSNKGLEETSMQCGSSSSEHQPPQSMDQKADAYYSVALPSHHIQYMNNPSGVQSFLNNLKGAYCMQVMKEKRKGFFIVSIDAEWKPMMFEKGGGVALMQIGLGDEVYLIDIYKLKTTSSESNIPEYKVWEEILIQLFSDEKIVKIGFGLESDLKMLANTCSKWQNIKEHFKSFVDLNKVYSELVKRDANFFPFAKYANSTGQVGLSELVRLTFGKPLSKDEQFSNWENRPLRDAQVQYAAADAYVLLELYHFMTKRSQELGIDLNELFMEILNKPKPLAGHKKKKQNQTSVVHKVAKTARFLPDNSPYRTPQVSEDVKLICDNMVQGLGKQLRACGIDTLILENDADHEQCAQLAFRENRTILTRGHVYDQLSSMFPELSFFNVAVDKLEDQLNEVLSYFNLSICEADIFSRCKKCNSGTFISVSRRTMEYLLTNRNRILGQSNYSPEAYNNMESLTGEITYTEVDGQIVKKWNLLPESAINVSDFRNIRTSSGVQVIFDKITPAHTAQIPAFIICDKCGKVYWDGSHLKRVKEGKSILPIPRTISSAPNRLVSSNSRPHSTITRPNTNNLHPAPVRGQHYNYDQPPTLNQFPSSRFTSSTEPTNPYMSPYPPKSYYR